VFHSDPLRRPASAASRDAGAPGPCRCSSAGFRDRRCLFLGARAGGPGGGSLLVFGPVVRGLALPPPGRKRPAAFVSRPPPSSAPPATLRAPRGWLPWRTRSAPRHVPLRLCRAPRSHLRLAPARAGELFPAVSPASQHAALRSRPPGAPLRPPLVVPARPLCPVEGRARRVRRPRAGPGRLAVARLMRVACSRATAHPPRSPSPLRCALRLGRLFRSYLELFCSHSGVACLVLPPLVRFSASSLARPVCSRPAPVWPLPCSCGSLAVRIAGRVPPFTRWIVWPPRQLRPGLLSEGLWFAGARLGSFPWLAASARWTSPVCSPSRLPAGRGSCSLLQLRTRCPARPPPLPAGLRRRPRPPAPALSLSPARPVPRLDRARPVVLAPSLMRFSRRSSAPACLVGSRAPPASPPRPPVAACGRLARRAAPAAAPWPRPSAARRPPWACPPRARPLSPVGCVFPRPLPRPLHPPLRRCVVAGRSPTLRPASPPSSLLFVAPPGPPFAVRIPVAAVSAFAPACAFSPAPDCPAALPPGHPSILTPRPRRPPFARPAGPPFFLPRCRSVGGPLAAPRAPFDHCPSAESPRGRPCCGLALAPPSCSNRASLFPVGPRRFRPPRARLLWAWARPGRAPREAGPRDGRLPPRAAAIRAVRAPRSASPARLACSCGPRLTRDRTVLLAAHVPVHLCRRPHRVRPPRPPWPAGPPSRSRPPAFPPPALSGSPARPRRAAHRRPSRVQASAAQLHGRRCVRSRCVGAPCSPPPLAPRLGVAPRRCELRRCPLSRTPAPFAAALLAGARPPASLPRSSAPFILPTRHPPPPQPRPPAAPARRRWHPPLRRPPPPLRAAPRFAPASFRPSRCSPRPPPARPRAALRALAVTPCGNRPPTDAAPLHGRHCCTAVRRAGDLLDAR